MKRGFILSGLALLGLTIVEPSSAIIDAAVAIWLFDEGEGLDAKDSTRHENHGELKSRAEWVGGKFGTALEFDGKKDYVNVPDSPSLNITEAITIVMWAKRNNTGNDDNERAVIKGSLQETGGVRAFD